MRAAGFALTDEHWMVRAMVRQLAEKEAAPCTKEMDEKGEWGQVHG